MLQIIRQRFTGNTLYQGEHATMRDAVEAAVAARVSLRCADLRDTSLSGAVLSDAVLIGATLNGTNLSSANLRGAALNAATIIDTNLNGTDLSGATLSNAVLNNSSLINANLNGADLRCTCFRGSNLSGADFRDTNLVCTDFNGADLRGADFSGHGAPIVQDLDAQILTALDTGGKLDMGAWHTCETTHCRAGWAIALAGTAGKGLERRVGPAAAGALICAASYPGEPVPDFYCDDEEALEDIRRRATK